MNDTNEADSNEAERLQKMVNDAALKLSDHFDSVRIFVTMPSVSEGCATACYSVGEGNFYAQQGQIVEWLQRQTARVWIDEKKDSNAGE